MCLLAYKEIYGKSTKLPVICWKVANDFPEVAQALKDYIYGSDDFDCTEYTEYSSMKTDIEALVKSGIDTVILGSRRCDMKEKPSAIK